MKEKGGGSREGVNVHTQYKTLMCTSHAISIHQPPHTAAPHGKNHYMIISFLRLVSSFGTPVCMIDLPN